jgi:tetratricopeptide (TPR) repeat protein
MKSKWSERFSKGFLFLIGGFLILFSPCAGKAQNNSTVNLAGTMWNRTPQFIEFPSDGTFATLRHSYAFERQGKVKYALSTIKPAGQELKWGYNSISDRYDLHTVPTIPLNTFQTFDGTYEINGISIYLDFPAYTVSATIYSDSMKGELTYKVTNKKEEWIVRRESKSNQPNESPSARSPHANVVRESDGKLRPADGYRWVDPNDPKDFRVEPLPGVSRSEEPANNPAKRMNAEELFTKGGALQEQKRYSEAIEIYTAAIRIDPNDPRPYFNRGAAKSDLSDYQGAIADFNQFLQLCIATKADYEGNPNKGDAQRRCPALQIQHAYIHRGFVKEKLGDRLGACEDHRTSCILGHSAACEYAKRFCN